jgi:hypothetical protein
MVQLPEHKEYQEWSGGDKERYKDDDKWSARKFKWS